MKFLFTHGCPLGIRDSVKASGCQSVHDFPVPAPARSHRESPVRAQVRRACGTRPLAARLQGPARGGTPREDAGRLTWLPVPPAPARALRASPHDTAGTTNYAGPGSPGLCEGPGGCLRAQGRDRLPWKQQREYRPPGGTRVHRLQEQRDREEQDTKGALSARRACGRRRARAAGDRRVATTTAFAAAPAASPRAGAPRGLRVAPWPPDPVPRGLRRPFRGWESGSGSRSLPGFAFRDRPETPSPRSRFRSGEWRREAGGGGGWREPGREAGPGGERAFPGPCPRAPRPARPPAGEWRFAGALRAAPWGPRRRRPLGFPARAGSPPRDAPSPAHLSASPRPLVRPARRSPGGACASAAAAPPRRTPLRSSPLGNPR